MGVFPRQLRFALGLLLLTACVALAACGGEGDAAAKVSQQITKPLAHPSGYVALSYDDGPNETYTAQLLDSLKANQAPATFFLVGDQAVRFPDLVRREIAEGHVVGNHTWEHPDLVSLPDAEARDQIARTNTELASLGADVHLFRPPYDSHDERIDGFAKDAGLTTASWTYARDPRDWDDSSGKGKSAADVCAFVGDKSEAGDVVVLHDKFAGTVDATSCMIAGLRARGLEPARILEAQGPSPQNGGTWIRVAKPNAP
jgi:peptidoglycan/xylan/chitin deacetylase (PgdA/CDA1 family)